MELQTLYLASPREASMKKKSFEPKTLKFFIVCSPPSRGPAFQASVFQASASAPSPTSHPSTESSSAVLTCSPNCVVLGHVPNQTSRQKSLYGQYWRNEVEASRAARIRCRGSENQSGRAEKRSGQICWRRWDAAPLRVTFCIWNHLNKAHRPEILLAKPQKRRWSLCQGLQHLFIV